MGQKVAVIGPGAIGGLLASSLHRAGFRVGLVCRDARSARALRRSGLTVIGSEGGRFRWRPGKEAFAPGPEAPAAVFLCVKAGDLPAALRSARAAAGARAPVVSLLNGVSHVGPMLKAFGPKRSVFAANYIASTRLGPGRIRHAGGRRVALARERGNREAVEAARAILQKAGWTVEISPSRDRMLWTKLVFNAAANPLGALTLRSNAQLASIPALRDLLVRATREGARIARAAGRAPLHSDMERRILSGCLATRDQRISMAQDLAAGRPTEADSILKPLLDEARRKKVAAPLLGALYRMVKRLEAALRRG